MALCSYKNLKLNFQQRKTNLTDIISNITMTTAVILLGLQISGFCVGINGGDFGVRKSDIPTIEMYFHYQPTNIQY